LGTILKKLRLIRGFTQAEIAQIICVSLRQYQRIEGGKSFITQEKLNRLEDTFQIPQRVLLAKNIEEIPSYYKYYLTTLDTDN